MISQLIFVQIAGQFTHFSLHQIFLVLNDRCYPITVNYAKRWTIQSPPQSYIAGLRQVSEATSPLSRSNHREIPEEGRRKKICKNEQLKWVTQIYRQKL